MPITADSDAEQQPVAGDVLQRGDLLGDPPTGARSGAIRTPSPSLIVDVAPATAARTMKLSITGTPVPAISWSTTQTDSKPSDSAWCAAAATSPGTESRVLMLGRNTPTLIALIPVTLQPVGYRL